MIRVRLRDVLKERSLSMAELARRAGLRYQTVLELAKGRTSGIDWATLDAICTVLGTTPADLLLWSPDRRK